MVSMTEVLTPRTDQLVAEFGADLGLTDPMISTLRAEETAPRIESMWIGALPFMLRTEDYGQIYLPQEFRNKPLDRAADFVAHRTGMWLGDAERRRRVFVTEESVIRAIHTERQTDQREISSLIASRYDHGYISVGVVPLEAGGLPPLPRGFTLFWNESDETPQTAYAVSVNVGVGHIQYFEDPAVIKAYSDIQRVLSDLALQDEEALQYIGRLDRSIHPYPDPSQSQLTERTTGYA